MLSTGPFGYSRNPAYLSLTMLIFGIAIAVDSLRIFVTTTSVTRNSAAIGTFTPSTR